MAMRKSDSIGPTFKYKPEAAPNLVRQSNNMHFGLHCESWTKDLKEETIKEEPVHWMQEITANDSYQQTRAETHFFGIAKTAESCEESQLGCLNSTSHHKPLLKCIFGEGNVSSSSRCLITAGKQQAPPSVLSGDKLTTFDDHNSVVKWANIPQLKPEVRSAQNKYQQCISKGLKSNKDCKTLASVQLSCPYCPFQSKYVFSLQRHLIVHSSSEDQPYACSQCHYRTNQKGNYKKHLLTHCKDREKPFACDLCDYKTDIRNHLQRHSVIHEYNREKTISCNRSDIKTDIVGSFQQHCLTQELNKIKRLASEHCDYRTDKKDCLKDNIQKHNGFKPEGVKFKLQNEKPFRCVLCNYSSSFKSNLLCHQKTHDK